MDDGDPRLPGGVPLDLAAVVVALALSNLVAVLPTVRNTAAIAGLPVFLFVAGYAAVAALFPGRAGPGAVDGVERATLAVALSLAATALVAATLAATVGSAPVGALLRAVSALALGATAVAAGRRWALPPDERFAVPLRRWVGRGRAAVAPESDADRLLNAALVVALVLAASGAVYAVAAPGGEEPHTEFYLLAENESGTTLAAGYPTNLTAGEPRSVVVGIENREGRPVSYAVVVLLQRVERPNGTVEVAAERRLDRFSARVGAGDTWRESRAFAPRTTGDDLRVTYLLYRGDPPADPSVATAYRSVHLQVTVEAP